MTDRDSPHEEKPNERGEQVNRDPSAKLVRDLATTAPAKELQTLKAAIDAAERDDVAAAAHMPRRASR